MKLLFVCLGNICRSPAAEAIMRSVAREAGISGRVRIDSAGILQEHEGEHADPRMREMASRRGYAIESIARPVTSHDMGDFDLILAMDKENLRDLRGLATTDAQREKIRPFCDFCMKNDIREIPDPYYGGIQGFQQVITLLEDGCQGLLAEIQRNIG